VVSTSALSLQQICEKFTNAKLYGKMVNIRSDLVRVSIKGIENVKPLTGDDFITAQEKGRDPFMFENQAKVFLSGNETPKIPSTGVTKAFYGRWIPIDFPNRFTGVNKDTDIVKKYTTPEMKSAILNWGIVGLQRLRENNWVFTYSPSVEKVREWFEGGIIYNDVENFIVENCKWNPNEYSLKDKIYEQYKEWCEYKELPVLVDNIFHRMMKHNRVYDVAEFRPTIDGVQRRAWKGIKVIQTGPSIQQRDMNLTLPIGEQSG